MSNEELDLSQVLDVLDNKGNGAITLSTGKVVTIKKCTVRASGRVIIFLQGAVDDVVNLQSMVAEAKKAVGELDANSVSSLLSTADPKVIDTFLQMLAKYIDKLEPVVNSLTNLEDGEFSDMEIDDAISVVFGIWTVNKSFFSGRVLAMFRAIKAQTQPEESKQTETE